MRPHKQLRAVLEHCFYSYDKDDIVLPLTCEMVVKRINQFAKPWNNNQWAWEFVDLWNSIDKREKLTMIEELRLPLTNVEQA